MVHPLHNPRTPEVEVDSMFFDRWSPRSFSPEPLSHAQIASLFEAVRWAPSCFNEQPWLFLYATEEPDHGRFVSLLVEKNQVWARHAPLLLFVLARRTFAASGRPNRHATFDAGAAWLSLALQARKLGLHAHGMAGFHREEAYRVLDVPRDDYEIVAAIAVGRRASPEQLPPDVAERERPNERRPLAEVARPGRF
jgi:nitroreductase